jgi:hypothetical protein
MDEVSAALEETPFVQGDISGDLLHPGFMGIRRDAGNLYSATFKVDEEQHVVSDQAAQRQYFYRGVSIDDRKIEQFKRRTIPLGGVDWRIKKLSNFKRARSLAN